MISMSKPHTFLFKNSACKCLDFYGMKVDDYLCMSTFFKKSLYLKGTKRNEVPQGSRRLKTRLRLVPFEFQDFDIFEVP